MSKLIKNVGRGRLLVDSSTIREIPTDSVVSVVDSEFLIGEISMSNESDFKVGDTVCIRSQRLITRIKVKDKEFIVINPNDIEFSLGSDLQEPTDKLFVD